MTQTTSSRFGDRSPRSGKAVTALGWVAFAAVAGANAFGFMISRPDRDMDDVIPEVNEARKALKKAIKEAVRRGSGEELRVAEILRRAAQEIRSGLEEDTTEVDLG